MNQQNFRFPLNVGNHWEYQIDQSFTNYKDTLGNPLPDDSIQFNVTIDIDSLVRIENFPRYRVSNTYEQEWSSEICYEYPFNDDQGMKAEYFGGYPEYLALFPTFPIQSYPFKNLLIDSNIPLEPVIFLKYPLQIGTYWEIGLGSWDTLRKEVLAIELVTTEAGIFECYKIKYFYKHQTDTKITDYINNIGLVRRETIKKNISSEHPINKKKKTADLYEKKDLVKYNIK